MTRDDESRQSLDSMSGDEEGKEKSSKGIWKDKLMRKKKMVAEAFPWRLLLSRRGNEL